MTAADRLALLIALAPLLTPSSALAADGATEADARFREGVSLFDAGRIPEACAKFAESYRLDPANGTLQNEALCHAREGKTASAWSEFALLAGRAAEAGQRDREQMARAQVAELEKRLARVELEIDASSNVEEVLVDGEPLGRATWATPLPLDPGRHAIEFHAPGKRPAMRLVTLPAGAALVHVTVPVFEDAPAPEPAREAPVTEAPTGARERAGPAEPDGHGARTAAAVTGVAGIALLGAGTYFGLRTLAKKSDGDAHCAGSYCDAEGLALESDAHSSATWSTITFGAGLAAIGVATVLWLTSPSSPSSASPAAAARVVPVVGRQNGLLLRF